MSFYLYQQVLCRWCRDSSRKSGGSRKELAMGQVWLTWYEASGAWLRCYSFEAAGSYVDSTRENVLAIYLLRTKWSYHCFELGNLHS